MAHPKAVPDYYPPCVKTRRRKISYATKAEAKRKARSGVYQGADAIHPYRCPHCGFWHLSSQVPQSPRS